jgi:hypothetical protein
MPSCRPAPPRLIPQRPPPGPLLCTPPGTARWRMPVGLRRDSPASPGLPHTVAPRRDHGRPRGLGPHAHEARIPYAVPPA